MDFSSFEPLLEVFIDYLPRIIGAVVILVIGWIIAKVVSKLVTRGLAATSIDNKVPADEPETKPLSSTLGDVCFWLIMLLILPAIVGVLQMQGLMAPFTDMVQGLLGFVPNIIAALFIGGIGFLIATVLRNLVTSLLTATRVDRLGADRGGGIKISSLCGTLVFIVVLVPALIAALQALEMEAIAAPAENMLAMFLAAIPNLVAAAIILAIAWFVGRFIADMLSQLLAQIGFDSLPARLGFEQRAVAVPAADGTPAGATPSSVVGNIVLFFVMAFAVVEAANLLGFGGINALFEQLIAFAAQVLFGLIILAVGQWLANLAANAIRSTSGDNAAMARIARIAILGLVVAMGLNAMGVADTIVNLAFGLTLGAVAVATALAFGLGGRDAAGRLTRHWVDGYLDKNDR